MSSPVFRRLGGVYQLELSQPDDLLYMDALDPARWAVTSAPSDQLHLDDRAGLGAVDLDGDGRIRVSELRQARAWLWARLAKRDRLVAKAQAERERLRPADLDSGSTEGGALRALAQDINRAQGRAADAELSLTDLRAFRAAYVQRFPNGDGVLPPAHAEDDVQRAVVDSVVQLCGGAPDHSGAAGATPALVDAWAERLRTTLTWRAAGRDNQAAFEPLGAETGAAVALLDRLSPPLRRWFAQGRLLSVEAGAQARLITSAEQLAALDVQDPAAIRAWLEAAPVAPLRADGQLSLQGPHNPLYTADLDALATTIGPRLLQIEGPLSTLSEAQLDALHAALAAGRAHAAAAPVGVDPALSDEALLALLEGPGPQAVKDRCAADAAAAGELAQIGALERLILLQAHLWALANTLVSIPQLFTPGETALMVYGRLVIDGRRLNLCQRVFDKAAHKTLAATSQIFVVYAEITRRDAQGARTELIAAGITAGTRGGVAVGKRGVFYDRTGAEWDALVVDVIANPISITEAMIAPFVRIWDAIMARVEAAAGEQSKGLEGELSTTAAATSLPTLPPGGAPAPAAPEPAPASPPAPAGGGLQAALIGGSVAFAAIGSSLAFIMKELSEIAPLNVVLSVLGIAAGLAGFSAFLAWLKLRRRDLSALLEASGMALNARMLLSRYLAGLFTIRPDLLPGSERRDDEPKGTPEKLLLMLFVLALALGASFWAFGDQLMAALPTPAVQPEAAPEAAAPPAPTAPPPPTP
ncbi:MAG: hypothetical protein JNM72_02025 [Deltaproteobacteria bacterium]|nr:hypothetical protein [Deltaproteobacteria bacterium]